MEMKSDTNIEIEFNLKIKIKSKLDIKIKVRIKVNPKARMMITSDSTEAQFNRAILEKNLSKMSHPNLASPI